MSEQAAGASGRRRRKKARPDAWSEFRGLTRRPSGKFGAQVREFKGGVYGHRWLGTFDTARAFDAAAVELHGAAAKTNFEQLAATDDSGVSPLLAGPCVQEALTELRRGVHGHPSGAQTWGSKGDAAMSLGGVELTPAELLMDLDSADDREALIEAAAILRQISLADGGGRA